MKDFYLILTNQPGDKSWPITAATYMLLRKDSPADQNHLALKFLDWALKKGQEQSKALDYVPLPDERDQADRGALEQGTRVGLENGVELNSKHLAAARL